VLPKPRSRAGFDKPIRPISQEAKQQLKHALAIRALKVFDLSLLRCPGQHERGDAVTLTRGRAEPLTIPALQQKTSDLPQATKVQQRGSRAVARHLRPAFAQHPLSSTLRRDEFCPWWRSDTPWVANIAKIRTASVANGHRISDPLTLVSHVTAVEEHDGVAARASVRQRRTMRDTGRGESQAPGSSEVWNLILLETLEAERDSAA
jgi:hypothetical protein